MPEVTQETDARVGTSSASSAFPGLFPDSLSLRNSEPSGSLELGLRRGTEWPTWAGAVGFRGLAQGLFMVSKAQTIAKRMRTAGSGTVSRLPLGWKWVYRKGCNTGRRQPTFGSQAYFVFPTVFLKIHTSCQHLRIRGFHIKDGISGSL